MTTDFADTSLDTQASAADATALSDDRIDTPVLTDAGTPAGDGQESAQDQATTETLAELKDEALAQKALELRTRHDAGDLLTTEEKQTVRRYEQSETDKAFAQNQARQSNQERMQALAQGRTLLTKNAKDARVEEQQLAEYEGRPFSDSLYEARLEQKNQPVMQALEHVAAWPVEAHLRSRVFQVLGDTPQTRAAVAGAVGLPGALELYERTIFEAGMRQSEDGKKLAKVQADYDKLKADHARLVGSDVKGSGASTQGKQASAGEPTYAQILKMKPEDVRAIPPDVYLRVLEKGA